MQPTDPHSPDNHKDSRSVPMLLTRWETLPSLQSTANGAFPLHGTVRYGSVRFTFAGFSTGYCTWYFFSTTSDGVPSDAYRYLNMTCKLYWSLIGRRKSSLLRHWTCVTRPNIDPLDLNQHSQRRIRRNFCLNKRTFLYQPKNVCWGSTDVPLVYSWGVDSSILIDLSIAVKNIHMPRMKNTIPSICCFVVCLFVARLGWCHGS